MALSSDWFSEICRGSGTAFSLEIKEKLHEEQSPFQKIEIYDTATFGKLMIIDGCTMLSTRDNFIYHEMMSHPALYSHPDPQRIVIIGGGDCGTLHEVLKHPGVNEARLIDIDERVTRLSEIYFPELCASNHDRRATISFEDGIQWMKNTAPDSIDIIIVDSTDPVGPAKGLFTCDFFIDCLSALQDDGIIAQQSESPLLHMDIINNMHHAMREAGFNHVKTLTFPQCIYPSGWWSCTMASRANRLDGVRIKDINARPVETRYYNAGIHQAALALPEFMKNKLRFGQTPD